MHRFLLGFALGVGLFAAGSASALVMTSGTEALLHSGGRDGANLTLHIGPPKTPLLVSLATPIVTHSVGPLFESPRFTRWPSRAPATRLREILFAWIVRAKLKLPMLEGPLFHPLRPPRGNDAVPEPGTAMLFGAGLVGMGLWRRHRRRRR